MSTFMNIPTYDASIIFLQASVLFTVLLPVQMFPVKGDPSSCLKSKQFLTQWFPWMQLCRKSYFIIYNKYAVIRAVELKSSSAVLRRTAPTKWPVSVCLIEEIACMRVCPG
jgi:hypothetical protein